ncbi:MAG: ABC transporter ATP-binding protein [Halofilum sp. (in: g-proteobacteria)]
MPTPIMPRLASAEPGTDGAPALAFRDVGFGYGATPTLDGIDLALDRGSITALCGPNGSGKSTLLRLASGLLAPARGAVELAGTPLSRYDRRALGRHLALLPQAPSVPEGLTVAEVVALARFPHQGLLGRADDADRRAVADALDQTGVAAMADRPLDALSGGERQRAWIAATLAQGAELLLLDEPTTFLDPQFQVEILRLVHGLARERGLTVVWVLHDLNEAAAWSERLVLLADGRVAADGDPDAVLTAATVQRVFGLDAHILTHPESGRPLCVPRHGRLAEPVASRADGVG